MKKTLITNNLNIYMFRDFKANELFQSKSIFKYLLLSVLVSVVGFSLSAQESDWLKEQEEVQHLFDQMNTADEDDLRLAFNDSLLIKVRTILKKDESFSYAFDSVKNMGVLLSSDEKVKVYTWNVPFNDGTHQYFGFVQYKKGRREINTYELKDTSNGITSPENKLLDKENWYGALYYRILVNKNKGEVYYTLLGSDLNDFYTRKKLVEIIRFQNDNLVFGAPVFKNQEGIKYRLIFEYSAKAVMGLKYDENREMIVYDHLSPFQPGFEGNPHFYGPDFSYDGLKFERGIWNTYKDLDIRRFNMD